MASSVCICKRRAGWRGSPVTGDGSGGGKRIVAELVAAVHGLSEIFDELLVGDVRCENEEKELRGTSPGRVPV